MSDHLLRWRDLTRLAGTLVAETVLLALLWAAAPLLGSVPFTHLGSWVHNTAPADAFTAIVRLAGLALSGWLLLSTTVYFGASLAGAQGLVRRTSWVTLPVVRRMIDGFAAASILASTVTASATGALSASRANHTTIIRTLTPPAPTAASRHTSERLASAPKSAVAVSDRVVGRHLPHPGVLDHVVPISYSAPATEAPSESNQFSGLPPGTKVVVVQPGNCLSVIAQQHLGDWRLDAQIHQLNAGRLQPDGRALSDDHWIYPGWVLVMPPDAVGTQIVPAPIARTAPGSVQPPTATAVPPQTPLPTTNPASTAKTTAPERPMPSTSPTTPHRTGDHPGPTRPEPTAGRPASQQPPAATHLPDARPDGHSASGVPTNVPVAPIIGIAGLVAAGVIWQLGRRRRDQMHTRRTGRALTVNPPHVVAAETQARAIADDTAMRWVDAGLRYLGAQLADRVGAATDLIDNEVAQPAVVPSVVLVRAGVRGLEVMISPSCPDAPDGWEAIDEGSVWTLRPELSLEELEARAERRWSFVPALVTLGTTVDGPVLANLEHAGSLAVEGDPTMVRAALEQVLLELTSQPWADEMLDGLHVVGNPSAKQLPGVVIDDDPMTMAEILDRAADQSSSQLYGYRSVAARRAVTGEPLPRVAVAFAATDPKVLRCLIEAALPDRSGVAVVAAGPAVDARWRLTVDAEGHAALVGAAGEHPFQLALQVTARADVIEALGQAMTAAVEPADKWLPTAAPAPKQWSATPVEPMAAGEVEIRILGTVCVAGGSGRVEAGRRDAPLAVLAYLATRPGPVGIGDLTAALWQPDATKERFGMPAPKTVHNVVSRAKALVGQDANGAYRIRADHGGYVLGPSVVTDWQRFQNLAQLARQAHSPEDTIRLHREALELVHGRPFAGSLDSRFFEWVSAEQLEHTIIATVVDTAEELASSALEAADVELALWAVKRGLEVDPVREELYRMWMQALGDGPDPVMVTRVWDRLRTALQDHIDPTQEPSPESQAVYRSCVAGNDLCP